MTEDRMEAEVVIDASSDPVWEAWVDPVHIANWFVDEARGRIGESGSVTWIWQQMGVEVEHEAVDVEPGRRFELRSRAEDGTARSTEVTLTGEDGGRTRVRVVESGFAGADPGAVLSGWQMALALLKAYVEEHFGRDVRSTLVMAETEADPGEVVAAFRTREGLSRWVGATGGLPEEGGAVALELEDGVRVDGRVLRHTATETSLTWPAIEGVLELKQFTTPEGRAVALRAFSWGDEDAVDLADVQEVLGQALERLKIWIG